MVLQLPRLHQTLGLQHRQLPHTRGTNEIHTIICEPQAAIQSKGIRNTKDECNGWLGQRQHLRILA
jgi:hypothetical protein